MTSPVCIVGATGQLGYGLALRLGHAGTPIVIGSRDAGRAQDAASRATTAVPHGTFSGAENPDAVRDCEIVILSVPFASQADTLKAIKESLTPDQLVIDATVPLATAVGGKPTRTIAVWQGSAAEQAQEMVPEGVRVVSAFQTVSAETLTDLDHPLDEDVLVCGDRRADKDRAAGDGPDRRDADAVADLDQHPQQGPRRDPDHRTLRVTTGPVVVLAGGTGGAKLARGMLDVAGDELVVIANTGDDVEIYGAYVSPDPDLVTYWLADRIDARGWGLEGDTFAVMDGLRALGEEIWFNLGDRDLASGVHRARRLAEGARLTEAQQEIATALGLGARVLPMSDRPVRTRVLADDRWWPLQEFMIRRRGEGPIQDIEFRHAAAGTATPEVIEALATARAIVIGPSNPIISVGPILAIPGIADAIRDGTAPVVAVSPLVQGAVLKGPTAACLQWAGHRLDSDGIVAAYAGLIDGLVADTPPDDAELPTLQTDVLLDTPQRRRAVAEATLTYALGLASV
jgi:LPPG:FO 2-phospho-L-lactate transferase